MISHTPALGTALAAIVAITGLGDLPAAMASEVEASADRVLRAMGDYLKQSDQFTFRVEELYDVRLEVGAKLQLRRVADVAVVRPDRLYAHSRGDISEERLWLANGRLTMLDVRRAAYATAEVPASIDGALDRLANHYGLTISLADIVYADPYSIMIENVQKGLYLGKHSVRGQSAHHLLFVQDDIDWQVWVADGFVPVPMKVVLTFKKADGHPRLVAWLTDWEFSSRLPASLFDFAAPSWANEMKFEALLEQRKRSPGSGN